MAELRDCSTADSSVVEMVDSMAAYSADSRAASKAVR